MIDFSLLFECIFFGEKGDEKKLEPTWLDYPKIPCISPSKYKLPKPVTQ